MKQPIKRIRALDGIRAIAALAVIWAHTSQSGPIGAKAVEVFFVLSGFLVGGILMDTAPTPGWQWRFWIRRGFRIWPLYFVVVILLILTDSLVPVEGHLPHWSLWTFTVNFAKAGLPEQKTRLATSVLWSIAVEEHFYLLAPLVVGSIKRVDLPKALLLIGGCSALLRGYLGHTLDGGTAAAAMPCYVLTFTRLDGLCWGLFAAWLWRYHKPLPYHVAALLLLGGLIAKPEADMWNDLSWYGVLVRQELTSIGAGALILALVHQQMPVLDKMLSWKPLAWLGTISFGTYMLHGLFVEATDSLHWHSFPWFILVSGLTVPVAALSWYWFEKPLLTWAPKQNHASSLSQPHSPMPIR